MGATIRVRTTKAGEVRYNVRWREAGQERSVTTASSTYADRLVAVINVHGRLPTELLAAPASPTLEAAVAAHLAELSGVEPRTLADYRRDAQRWLAPLLPIPLAAIDRAAVVRLVARWQRDGASSKTISNQHGLLSAILTTAQRRGWIQTHPSAGMRLPRHDEHEREDMVVLTPDQFRLILGYTAPPWRPVLEVLAGTGMRWGELGALLVGDVDLDRARIRITKAVKRDADNHKVIGPTKTERSRRWIDIGPSLLEVLAPLVDGRPREAPLFVTDRGTALPYTDWYKKAWRPAVRLAEAVVVNGRPAIPVHPTPHDLRHCHASWLLGAGVPVIVVSRRLGHKSVTTTMNTYGHLMPDAQSAAVEAMESLMVVDEAARPRSA